MNSVMSFTCTLYLLLKMLMCATCLTKSVNFRVNKVVFCALNSKTIDFKTVGTLIITQKCLSRARFDILWATWTWFNCYCLVMMNFIINVQLWMTRRKIFAQQWRPSSQTWKVPPLRTRSDVYSERLWAICLSRLIWPGLNIFFLLDNWTNSMNLESDKARNWEQSSLAKYRRTAQIGDIENELGQFRIAHSATQQN